MGKSEDKELWEKLFYINKTLLPEKFVQIRQVFGVYRADAYEKDRCNAPYGEKKVISFMIELVNLFGADVAIT
ncbi:hypothetical protein KUTeg_022009 [Tegillarca granosa]|uniref:Uncharacterized protein n=1 Tax=Tegillarca granosa TaxID=220873 RepID=A0ABQ9EAH4_TEGGR|nr:hypothetical protein KUTeg_022009 [Tegillarca granosa]